MKHRQKATWFLSGMLAAALAISIIPTAQALFAKTIQIQSGINVYLDDQKLDPKDANGNPVEIFAYNGTTYLPVRAVSEALGVPVQWDGSTQSVYVGKHSSDTPAAYLSQMDYFSGTSDYGFYTSVSEPDNLGNTHYNCVTYSFDRTYILNGQYSRLEGTLYQTYERRSLPIYTGNGLSIYGDGRLIYNQSFSKGETGIKPVDFTVDLTGVLELRVVFDSDSNSMLSLGDVGLYT